MVGRRGRKFCGGKVAVFIVADAAALGVGGGMLLIINRLSIDNLLGLGFFSSRTIVRRFFGLNTDFFLVHKKFTIFFSHVK